METIGNLQVTEMRGRNLCLLLFSLCNLDIYFVCFFSCCKVRVIISMKKRVVLRIRTISWKALGLLPTM